MNNKIVNGLLVVVLAYSAFLTYKFFSLEQKITALEAKQSGNVNITPANGHAAHAGDQSPFDQANVDPMVTQQPAQSEGPQTVINFTKTEHDFGKLKAGEKVRTKFKFTNTGTNPLIISNAIGSCGCTVPQWPKEPIEPGKSGEIEVEFDSKGKSGEQTKNVHLTANAPTPDLTIKATVIPLDK